MPRLKPVPTLLDTCLQNLSNSNMKFIVKRYLSLLTNNENLQAEVNWSKHFDLKQINRNLKECILSSLRSQLLKTALYMVSNLKFNDIEEDLNSRLRILWDLKPQQRIWDIVKDILILYGGNGIQELHLQPINVPHTGDICIIKTQIPRSILEETLFLDKVWAENIRELKCPSVWYVDILESIASNCHNLQCLDIASEFNYNLVQQCITSEENVDVLGCLYGFQSTSDGLIMKENMGCPKLRMLTLPKFGDHYQVIDHVVHMIRFMPDLHYIRNVDTRLVAVQYRNLFGQQHCMKLTEFEEWETRIYQEKEQDSLNESLGKLFPEVKRCASYCIKNGIIPFFYEWEWLKSRANFPKLEELEIHCPQMLEEMDFVEPMPSVKVYKLYEIEHIDIEGMKILSSLFPNIEMLTFLTELYVCDDLEGDILFHKLRALQLYGISELDANFLKVVLDNSPSLTTLELFCTFRQRLMMGEIAPFNMELISTLGHSMNNLERVIIGVNPGECAVKKINLGSLAVENLLTLCPNLRCLGDLADWNVSRKKIIDDIKANNWDLEIVFSEEKLF